VNLRRKLQIARIQSQIEECAEERRRILAMLTSSQVNLEWAADRMAEIQKDLRILSRDLEAQRKLESEE
jgi:hypothetical protein